MRIHATRTPFLCQLGYHKRALAWNLNTGRYEYVCRRCGM